MGEKEVKARAAAIDELKNDDKGIRADLERALEKLKDTSGKATVAQVDELRKKFELDISQSASQIESIRSKQTDLAGLVGQKANLTDVQASFKSFTDPRLDDLVFQAGLKVEDLRKHVELQHAEYSQSAAQIDALRAKHADLVALVGQKANHTDVQASLKSFMDPRLDDLVFQASLKVDNLQKQFDREIQQSVAKIDALRAKHAELSSLVGQKANHTDLQASLKALMEPVNENFNDVYAAQTELKSDLKEYSNACSDALDALTVDVKKMLSSLEQNFDKDLEQDRLRNEEEHKSHLERDRQLDNQMAQLDRQLRNLIMDVLVRGQDAFQSGPAMLTDRGVAMMGTSPGRSW